VTTHERDLRSLERRSMYSIFAPLNENEPLPRELILEGRRYRSLGRREVAGAIWLPALVAIVVLAGWGMLNALESIVLVGVLFGSLCVFAVSGSRK
jgi:hypothetical protein